MTTHGAASEAALSSVTRYLTIDSDCSNKDMNNATTSGSPTAPQKRTLNVLPVERTGRRVSRISQVLQHLLEQLEGVDVRLSLLLLRILFSGISLDKLEFAQLAETLRISFIALSKQSFT